MKSVIIGCGRVGATLAEALEDLGHDVIIIDIRTSAFDRLSSTFRGSAIRGDGTDEDVLRRAGADDADLFIALTEGDNRNIMAAQIAARTFGIPRVVAKVNDPVRAEAYATLGIATLCRTNLMVDAIYEYLGLPRRHPPGVVRPTDVVAGVTATAEAPRGSAEREARTSGSGASDHGPEEEG
ncbi:MAG: TrkA family potassium uptake protein [Chloroflexota bacterium]